MILVRILYVYALILVLNFDLRPSINVGGERQCQ